MNDTNPKVNDTDPKVKDTDPKVKDTDPKVKDTDPKVKDTGSSPHLGWPSISSRLSSGIVTGTGIIIILLILGKYLDKIPVTWGQIAILCSVGIIIALVFFLSVTGSQCNPAEWYKHPLGLPTGSIRALIALLFVMSILLLAARSYMDSTYQPPSWILGIVGTIVGFYFGDRKSKDESGTG